MSLTTIRSPPSLSDYTPLPDHQSRTPPSFFDHHKPILHHHSPSAKAWLYYSSPTQLGKLPFFPADLVSPPTPPESLALSPDSLPTTTEQKVDVFVTSQNLTLFSPAAESGVTIPYHQISIHAIQKIGDFSSVYLQLELAEGGSEEDFDTVELTLIPVPREQKEEGEEEEEEEEVTVGDRKPKTETEKLFEAISECSNLNPDPRGDGEEDEEDEDGAQIIFEGEAVEGFSGVFAGARDGGLPAAMPGSSGWITAENVHEYFDAEGNWIGGGGDDDAGGNDGWVLSEQMLGGGAGTVHRMDEDEPEGEVKGKEGENNKRPKKE
ncbi:regulator of volume decrease after cellular swelling-domain-containing protein [Cercophora samala]|uniref:Regulator of volume decrease after cellular swelling-domain-containing protein n=1 Tax=Cercophora samala TaxID=330535 RepID=A0AA39YU75_9PEZI|nr:regulator of volume decrease after cellular swelling-domain-containing protein [Cercophora samala]